MKKLVIALAAVAAFTGSAVAADLGARPYTKAPAPVTPVYNWTGFYIFGGGGGGLWSADSNVQDVATGAALTRDQRHGGSGWFGTVGGGYDWQFGGRWVAGIFGDAQFGDIRGSVSDPFTFIGGTEGRMKLETSYAAGVRLGYLVAPNVLSYVNAGYSGSEWSGTTQSSLAAGLGGVGLTTTPSFDRNGWFIGGGVENNLDLFGISAPGWFMKTEYRSAFYDRVTLPTTFLPASGFAGPTGTAVTFKPWTQTISTSLVYRFNWGGAPVRY
ncbi:porin family protein [Bradyrhizobium sp. 200]|uniref:outer membrane protein n=1 Tax=Bradyrhizobium sp. 200 TaxID=2782665 RepID=UPI001FFE2F83|nr:porin family protein [Bradyrhizobium sp. 200]UPJ53601.1 porin family protein [Bradyrhizobium sp. 200]